jgi:hypothetical protein
MKQDYLRLVYDVQTHEEVEQSLAEMRLERVMKTLAEAEGFAPEWDDVVIVGLQGDNVIVLPGEELNVFEIVGALNLATATYFNEEELDGCD